MNRIVARAGIDPTTWRTKCECLNHNTTEDSLILEVYVHLQGVRTPRTYTMYVHAVRTRCTYTIKLCHNRTHF